jgi:hypothetical protein
MLFPGCSENEFPRFLRREPRENLFRRTFFIGFTSFALHAGLNVCTGLRKSTENFRADEKRRNRV